MQPVVQRGTEVTVAAGSEVEVSGVLTLRLLAADGDDGISVDDKTTMIPSGQVSAALRQGLG